MHTIIDLEVRDIRFPTSLDKDGSDAMNPDPDYSAAYVVIRTDRPDGITGHGLTFTIGRGTEVVVAAVQALRPLVVGQPLEAFTGAPGAFWKHLTGDSQLRWIGPEKGVIHLATAAVVNALWDLWAKIERKPLWKLLSDLTPAQVVELVDWRYLTDALTPVEALAMLEKLAPTKAAREAQMRTSGYPAYTTSAGWLGYSDEKIRRLCKEALAEGWTSFKVKVGADLEDDRRRCTLVRSEIGDARSHDRREPALGRPPGNRMGQVPRIAAPDLDRGADKPGRRARPCRDRQGSCSPRDRRSHGRALPEQGGLQAAAPGRRHFILPDRLVQARRRQRGRSRASPRGEIRGAGLPSRRGGRPLRIRAT
jgi:hypothetical protein